MSDTSEQITVLAVLKREAQQRARNGNSERARGNEAKAQGFFQRSRELLEAHDDLVKMIGAAQRALPFLQDEGGKYEDDGSNEPLETARDLEAALARIGGAA